jgi:Histidine kinase-, DNA gyrase B-, and HSP90-like ATPase
MLRTFCSNPTLGGFGSESSISRLPNDAQTPDAFCQIIKELVDNAVDACNAFMIGKENCMSNQNHQVKKKKGLKKPKEIKNDEKTPKKRVRVVIEPFMDRLIQSFESITNDNVERELLRVTVTDNGCGMRDIQSCVGAFHSSKVNNSTLHKCNDICSHHFQKSKHDFATNEIHTVGRYGIGLTLCLLHAQRLVPDSCASIQSAVPADREWKLVTAVVDTDLDRIQCFPRDGIPKSNPTESGTSISILVPVRILANYLKANSVVHLYSCPRGMIFMIGRFKRYHSMASFGGVFCTL